MHQQRPRSDYLGYSDSSPPDDGIQLPPTPPATAHGATRAWDTSGAGKAMQILEALRDRTSLEQCAPFSELQVSPPQYQELVKRLGDERAVAQYVDDKVR
jgi:hypothetical protein